ncbi:Inositolphosphorylceramide synthase subunit Kei1-domain-containing protein [Spinellus fusiger]|nr:Inositolphosphorylceramide synthase subunit Kei1-domain-containing protein [Spinellus fusiger]
MAHQHISSTCCGFIPLKTGVLIITVFGILNKICGPFGLLLFSSVDITAFSVYLYSIVALIVFIAGLYGLHKNNYTFIQWYTRFYWVDCALSLVTTSLFAIRWFMYTDHSAMELALDSTQQQEYKAMFRMESMVSIGILVVLRLVHIYFAIVLTVYYRSLRLNYYSQLSTEVEEMLSDKTIV